MRVGAVLWAIVALSLAAAPAHAAFPGGNGPLVLEYDADNEEDGGVATLIPASDTFEQISDIGYDPKSSPDGARVLYWTEATDQYQDRIACALRTIPIDGGASTLVHRVDRPHCTMRGDWTPEGDKIVFSDGQTVWAANADGTGVTQIHSGADALATEEGVVFTRTVGGVHGVYRVATTGGEATRIDPVDGFRYEPVESLGDRVVLAGGKFDTEGAYHKLVTVPVSGVGVPHVLRSGQGYGGKVKDASPDGSALVLQPHPYGGEDEEDIRWLVDARTGASRTIPRNSLTFSPDGLKLAGGDVEFQQIRTHDLQTGGQLTQSLRHPDTDSFMDWAPLSGQAPFEVTQLPSDPAQVGFRSQLEVAADRRPVRLAWDFGDGQKAGDITSVNHRYAKPGPYTVTHSGSDAKGGAYRTQRRITIPAPKLSVSITLAEDQLDGGRLPVGRAIEATIKVSASCNGVGALKGLTFALGKVLQGTPAERLQITGAAAPAAFSLEPCKAKELTVQVKGVSRGPVRLFTEVSGKDAADRAVVVESELLQRVGTDLQVTVTPTPAALDLVVDREADPPRPIPKPVSLVVEVKNVSGQPAKAVKLTVTPAVRNNVGRNPSAPFPLQLVKLEPDTPVTNDTARDLVVGDIADGKSKKLTFSAEAHDKAIVDVRAIARGVSEAPVRAVTGNGSAPVRIGQPTLLSLTATGPLVGAKRAGETWTYGGNIENLSPDESVTVYARAHRRGNVVEGQLDRLGDPEPCGCGIAYRLEPGERMPYFGALRGRADGPGTGTVEIQVGGLRHTYDAEGKPVGVPVAATEVAVAPGADKRRVEFNTFEPVVEPISIGGVGWLVSDSAARAFGARLTGAQESAAAALAWARTPDGAKLSVHLQQALAVIREEMPAAYVRARDELTATLLAFDDQLDSGEALNIATEVWGTGIVATEKAWEEATWQDLSTKTGTLLGTLAPELAVEAVLPALGACKLLKYGGKTAFLRKAEKLAGTRAARLAARGTKGALPGDEIDLYTAYKLWGIDEKIDERLRAYAQAKKLIIAVRDRSPGSVARLRQGMLPKWEKIKAKNVSSIDVEYLGFDRSHLDTAMLKQMPEESVIRARISGLPKDEQAKVMSRWKLRKDEWDGKDRATMEGYEQAGVIPKPSAQYGLNPGGNGMPDAQGVWVDRRFELARAGEPDKMGNVLAGTTDGLPAYQPRAFDDGAYRAMTGDMDPIAILDANGNIPSLERRLEIYRDMAKMGFQHPESLTWDNPAGRAKYLFDYDLANGDAESLLAYAPDGSRRAVYFDSRKSVLGDATNAFMALLGADMAFDAPGIVAGDVPLPAPVPDDDGPVYLTPGGDAGAKLVNEPGAQLIRRNLDGTFSVWTAEHGWQPYELPEGQTVTTVPQTSMRTPAAAGQTRIDINERDALILLPGAHAWFVPGDLVVIDPGGPNEEFVTVASLGSIVTTEPLRKAHRVGEMVAVVPGPAVVTPPTGTTPTPPAPTGEAAPQPQVEPPVIAEPKPRLSAVKLARRSFPRRKGTRLSFRVDRAATVTVRLTRTAKGRRKGRTCSTTLRTGKRCTAQVEAGLRRFAARPGATTSVAFGKGLRSGPYVARLSAGGNVVSLRFTVR
jgi:PKD repeat protein/Tol biopolymer transport system component